MQKYKRFILVQTKRLLLVFLIMLNIASSADSSQIIKSPIDEKSYRYLELTNKLRVVLVSDPQANKAAVSLDVAAGSGTDPKQWPGMAHFLEHMLFLGTKKYPQSGEYQAFIQKNGGSTNAFTAYDHTNYFYDIDPNFLQPSLDRFAQFFISPLFTETLVERERNAVDSEYYARRTDDFRRTWSARKQVFNPAHPITQFSIGNNETLADKEEQSVRDALIDFYQNYYSANIMTLAIMGKEPLDQLEQWAIDYFEDIPNHDVSPFQADVPLITGNTLPKLLEVKTLKQKYSINLVFNLPEVRSHYKTKPLHYLSNLLGHEGENSLLSDLKSKNWVDYLSAGAELNHPEGSSFTISIRASKAGFDHWQDIVGQVMDYIQLVQQSGIEQWRFDELAELSKLNFDYLQKNDASDYVVFLSSALQEYSESEILTASYLFSDYDQALIMQYAQALNLNNLLVTLVSPEFDSEQLTPYFNTPYEVSDLPPGLLERLSDNLKDLNGAILPGKNPFVPQNTALKQVEDKSQIPVALIDEDNFKYFYLNDLEFEAPRASTYLSIRSPIAGKSSQAEVLARLFTRMIKEQLNEELYPATLTGLQLDIYSHLRGLSIRITGFDDKQEVLLSRILDELVAPLNEDVFHQKKKELIDKYNNEKYDTPYFRLYEQASDLLVENAWPNQLLLDDLENLTFTQVETFQQDFFKQIDIVGLSHGNVTEQDADQIVNVISDKLIDKFNLVKVNHSRVVDLPTGSKTFIKVDLEHEDAAVVMFKQAQGDSFEDKASMYMLYQLLEAPFFHQLRTVEQLGYIVYVAPYLNLNTPYIVLIIESPTASVDEIINQINAFIAEFKTVLTDLSDEEFEAAKQGLIIKTDKRDETLENRSNRFWAEIDRQNYEFDSRKQLISAISALTKQQIIAEYDKVFFDPGFGEFTALAPGKGNFDQNAEPLKSYQIINEPKAFKLNAEYFD